MAQINGDPSRTLTLRRQYAGHATRRFRRVKSLIRTTIIQNDALRLQGIRAQQMDPPPFDPAGDFGTTDDEQRAIRFRRWLRRAMGVVILGGTRFQDGDIVERQRWQEPYVQAAFLRGINHADVTLRRSGVDVPQEDPETVVRTPRMAERLRVLQNRNFEELRGITNAMDQQITRELQDGLLQGLNPNDIASNINERVDAIGITRARTLARTEIIRAHADATLTRFQQMGVDDVGVLAEFATAGDALVCPICAGLEGQTMPVNQARGMIPQHPNCRCVFLPVTETADLDQLRQTMRTRVA